jgi:all-trans-retinol dehydrogenase (NAD+)
LTSRWGSDHTVVSVLRQTVFSAFFCAFIPAAIAGHAKSWSGPAVYWSAAWAGLLGFFGELLVLRICSEGVTDSAEALRYIGRFYAAAGSYFFLPPRLKWEEQIVLITGGESLRFSCVRRVYPDEAGGSGIGALLAQTLALRNVTVVILDVTHPKDPIENGQSDWR